MFDKPDKYADQLFLNLNDCASYYLKNYPDPGCTGIRPRKTSRKRYDKPIKSKIIYRSLTYQNA